MKDQQQIDKVVLYDEKLRERFNFYSDGDIEIGRYGSLRLISTSCNLQTIYKEEDFTKNFALIRLHRSTNSTSLKERGEDGLRGISFISFGNPYQEEHLGEYHRDYTDSVKSATLRGIREVTNNEIVGDHGKIARISKKCGNIYVFNPFMYGVDNSNDLLKILIFGERGEKEKLEDILTLSN